MFVQHSLGAKLVGLREYYVQGCQLSDKLGRTWKKMAALLQACMKCVLPFIIAKVLEPHSFYSSQRSLLHHHVTCVPPCFDELFPSQFRATLPYDNNSSVLLICCRVGCCCQLASSDICVDPWSKLVEDNILRAIRVRNTEKLTFFQVTHMQSLKTAVNSIGIP